MRGGSSVKSSLLASDMSSDKAAKLGLAPQRLVSCSQQNSYASLGLTPQVDGDKDARIDIEDAVKAVDMALAGLDLGSKRQSVGPSATAKPANPPLESSRRSMDAKLSSMRAARVSPKIPSRNSVHMTGRPWEEVPQMQHQHRGLVQDALSAMAQQNTSRGGYQDRSYLTRSSDDCFRKAQDQWSLGSGSQFNGLFASSGYGGSLNMGKGTFGQQEPAPSAWNAPGRYGSGGGSSSWNMQSVRNMIGQPHHQQQHLHSQQYQRTSPSQNRLKEKNAMDHLQPPPARQNSIFSQTNLDLLFNTADSLASQIDSRSSRKMKHNTPQGIAGGLFTAPSPLDSAMNLHLPEILGGDAATAHMQPGWKIVPDAKRPENSDIKQSGNNDARMKSEQALLLAIAGILKCALEGNLAHKDMKSDLNFLIVSVRKHLQDYQTISSDGSEMLLAIATTLPTICRAAQLTEDVISSLKRFMEVISAGNPMLQKKGVWQGDSNPKVQMKQKGEVQHMLTRIHRRLTGGSTSNGVQHVALALFESSGDIRCPPAPSSTTDAESRGSSAKSAAFSILNTRTTQGSISPTHQNPDDENDDAGSCASSGFSYMSSNEANKKDVTTDINAGCLDSARERFKKF